MQENAISMDWQFYIEITEKIWMKFSHLFRLVYLIMCKYNYFCLLCYIFTILTHEYFRKIQFKYLQPMAFQNLSVFDIYWNHIIMKTFLSNKIYFYAVSSFANFTFFIFLFKKPFPKVMCHNIYMYILFEYLCFFFI